MLHSIDLYLGSFLVISGFCLSLLNLRRLVKGPSNLPSVLLSENIILMCIGIAFILRAESKMNMVTTNMDEIEDRIASMDLNENMDCDFTMMLKTYGPFVISLVNSFLSLIIDNYMHFRMLGEIKVEDDENTVQDLRSHNKIFSHEVTKFCGFCKKHFSYVAIALQWIVPVLIAGSMYPVEVKERYLNENFHRSSDLCMALVDVSNNSCYVANFMNHSEELRKFIPPLLEANEKNLYSDSVQPDIDDIVHNVKSIISNLKNNSHSNIIVSSQLLTREPKAENSCMKICYIDNKNLLLYMFIVAVVSYFVPVTISTIILTKIYIMDVKRSNMKMYVSRELLYNLLFWTPAMFDTFLSLLLCSYSMNGMRTSIFNIVANVYQAIKNFVNAKYFKENAVEPFV